MTATATKRFVNLGKSRTTLPGPDGHNVVVHPFEDSLNDRIRKSDAVYVVEGDFWARYATGDYSQLSRFPRPSQYGRTSFPALDARHEDGRTVPVECDDVDAESVGVRVQAVPGKRRLAGDVVTPEGKIRKELPDGTVTLVDDTPENRHMVHSEAGVINERNPQIRDGIMSWLEEMHITTFRQFAELSDDVLLKIPGVVSANLPAIRKNIGHVFREIEALEQPDETPMGETAGAATQPKSIDDVLTGDDDEEEEETEETPPVTARKAKKKAKRKAKKKVTKKAATKKTAKKKSSRRPASD